MKKVIFCLGMLILFSWQNTSAQVQPPVGTPIDGLQAYYPFEGVTLADRGREQRLPMVNTNAATIAPTVLSTTGVRGEALSVRGDIWNYTNANPAATFAGIVNQIVNGQEEFTISFWFRSNTRITTTNGYSILSRRANCTANPGFLDIRLYETWSGNLGDLLSTEIIDNINDPVNADPLAVSPCWTHYVVTRSANPQQPQNAVTTVYLNGVLGSTTVFPFTNIVQTAANGLMALSGSPCIGMDGTLPFSGIFDELMVYDRAITATEVIDLNNAYTSCCPVATDASYFHISTTTSAADLAARGITMVGGTIARINNAQYNTLPSRVYIQDGITLEVSGVNTTLDITNVDMVFGQCAGVRAIGGGRIKAYNSVFRPCDDHQSWNGIEFIRAGSSIDFAECTFIQANRAIFSPNNGPISLSIQNCVFKNCLRGVNLVGVAGAGLATISLSDNTFEVDNHYEVVTYNCTNGLLDRNDIRGIDILGYLSLSPISQNQFINNLNFDVTTSGVVTAAPVARFTGIRLSNTIRNLTVEGWTIESNTFSNMFRSIDILPLSRANIENNTITVSRNSTTDNSVVLNPVFGDAYQIRITTAGSYNYSTIVGNQLINSGLLNNQVATGTRGAIFVGNTGVHNSVDISNNVIKGFEVGIHNSRLRGRITGNKIESYSVGIFVDATAIAYFSGSPLQITCNEITMKESMLSTSPNALVGLLLETGDHESSTYHHIVVADNCIKNTTRAIEFNHNSTTGLGQVPTLYSNYLYNYQETGLFISQMSGTVGNYGMHAIPARNTFISNNGGNSQDVFLTSTIAATVNFYDNDGSDNGKLTILEDGLADNVFNEGHELSNSACAHQNAGSSSSIEERIEWPNGGGTRLAWYSGICEDPSFLAPANFFATRLATGFNSLNTDFNIAIADRVELNWAFGEVTGTINTLTSTQEVTTFYNAVKNAGVLTAKENSWLDFYYHTRMNSLAAAQAALSNVITENNDEVAMVDIKGLETTLAIDQRSILELTTPELDMLKAIETQDISSSVPARELLHSAVGNYFYQFPLAPVPQRKTYVRQDLSSLNQDMLHIFPNPTSNDITIDVLKGAALENLRIFDMQGRLVQEVALNAAMRFTVSVQSLPSGVYILNAIDMNGASKMGKFVKN